ncbi:hypothetical protein S40288_01446 [Stachybotrys chartarum IBT 40288]|nr:hypothetical protein S40288_01446 [Stachybotrys chartarum IBT 40288]
MSAVIIASEGSSSPAPSSSSSRTRKRRAATTAGHGRHGKKRTGPRGVPKEDQKLEDRDESDLEMPTAADFHRQYGRLSSAGYTWGPKPEEPKIDLETVLPTPAPWVPCCGVPTSCKKVLVSSPPKETTPPPPPPPRQKACLASLPQEIRENIYRELLVKDTPILVHANWTMVYQRKKAGLSIDILAVCKTFKREAIPILYGENTFHYKIRDPHAVLVDVDDLISGGIEVPQVATDSEYEDEESNADEEAAPRTGGRRRAKTVVKPDIDINKYFHLFRHIIVEAEGNRTSEADLRRMSSAVSRFKPSKSHRNLKKRMGNIHTVVIRVYPTPTESSSWTFENFFAPSSPLLDALRQVECQFLNVELMWEPPSSNKRGKVVVGAHRTLTADMRALRLQRRALSGLPDVWSEDLAKLQHRLRQARKCCAAIANLRGSFLAACRARRPQAATIWDDADVDNDADVDDDLDDGEWEDVV